MQGGGQKNLDCEQLIYGLHSGGGKKSRRLSPLFAAIRFLSDFGMKDLEMFIAFSPQIIRHGFSGVEK